MKWYLVPSLFVFLCLFATPSWANLSFYRSATIDHTKVPNTDRSNYTVTVCFNSVSTACSASLSGLNQSGAGAHVQNVNGYDIRFFTVNTCSSGALSYELVTYTPSTGAAEFHVFFTSVSHTVDTVFYMCYDDGTINTDGSSTATWDSSYLTVLHLPNGSTLTSNDSTSNANNFAQNGSPGAVAGQIDGGASLTANTSSLSKTPYPLSFSAGSISMLLKPGFNSGDGAEHIFFGLGANTDTTLVRCEKFTDNNLYCGWLVGGTDNRVIVADTGIFTSGTWMQLTLTWTSGGNTALYSNTTSLGTHATGSPSSTGVDTKLCVGPPPSTHGNACAQNDAATEVVDEFKVANIAWSADQVDTDSNMDITPSTFITFGAETPVSGGGTACSGLLLRGAGC